MDKTFNMKFNMASFYFFLFFIFILGPPFSAGEEHFNVPKSTDPTASLHHGSAAPPVDPAEVICPVRLRKLKSDQSDLVRSGFCL